MALLGLLTLGARLALLRLLALRTRLALLRLLALRTRLALLRLLALRTRPALLGLFLFSFWLSLILVRVLAILLHLFQGFIENITGLGLRIKRLRSLGLFLFG